MPIGLNGPQATSLTQAKLVLDETTSLAGAYYHLTLILYTNNIVPNQSTAYADLAQPTFTGYAPHAAVTFGAADNNPGGGAVAYAPSITFACSGGTPAEVIYGWALVDAGLTTLMLTVPFVAPVPVVAVGDAVVVVPALTNTGQ